MIPSRTEGTISPTEAMARQIFLNLITRPAAEKWDTAGLAERAFDMAAEFQRVADRRR
jgi:hypothetical protein